MGTAKTRAQNRYINKRYDRINLVVEKGDKDKLKDKAKQQGQSLNAYIIQAIEERIQKEK